MSHGALRLVLFVSIACSLFLVGCGGRDEPERTPQSISDAPGRSRSIATEADRARPDRYLGQVPPFSLIDETGRPFESESLDGKIWVAAFTFTRCRGICPLMAAQLGKLQDELRGSDASNQVMLIDITVDPEHDTPEVLGEYAKSVGADPSRWKFLTGRRNQIRQLSRHGFKLPVEDVENVQMPIAHSQKFVLVDREGFVRGYFDGIDDAGRAELLTELRAILSEPAALRIAYPEDILDPPGLAARGATQRAGAGAIGAFHAFEFEDRAPESGITFVNQVTDDSGKTYKPVHWDHGNGVAVADVDGDGRLDAYLLTYLGSNELWRNLGNGEFENISASAGTGLEGKLSVTASFADTDNDGDADLYVTTVRGGNHLFVNDGTGRFADATESAGLGYVAHSSSAIFFDYNRDGLLDLFLCNVGVFTTDALGPGGYPIGVGDAFGGHLKPEERNERSVLFENQGGNRFVDVSSKRNLNDESWTGDAAAGDFNGDGWIDLYVLNMQGHDRYYENVEGQRFEDRTDDVFPKTPWGSMGVKSFDWDNDGDLDLFLTDMHSDMSENIDPTREKLKSRMQWPESLLLSEDKSIFGNAFFRNDGEGRFVEISDAIGAENYWPWGLSVGDLNADGYEDAFIASSMNYGFRYAVNTVLLNDRGQAFRDAEFILGVEPRRDGRTAKFWFKLDCPGVDRENPLCRDRGLLDPAVFLGAVGTRSSAIFDVDDDGDLDILTNEFHDRPMLLISDLSERRDVRWLQVRLVGNESNRDGLGARVTVHVGERQFLRVQDGKSGYLSQSRMPLYFGLGDQRAVDRIEVVWPSGKRQTLPGPIETNRTMDIVEP